MTGNDIDEFDRLLDEVLPDDLEEAVPSDDRRSTLSRLTFAQSVDDGDYQMVFDREINRLADALDVPAHAGRMASQIAQQFVDATDLSGRAIELWAAACLYCACKVTEVPLSPEDFTADESALTRKLLLHRTTEVASTVGLDPSAFFGSVHYADHYCEELGLPEEVRDRAREIVERLEEDGLSSGKSPSGWAAAAVYNAAREHGESVTQSMLSDVANVTEVTIRNRYQEQREALRDVEPTAATPEEQVAHIVTKTNTHEEIAAGAVELLERARAARIAVDEPSDAWAAAAVLASSEQHGDRLGLRTLQQYYDRDEVEIRTLATVLRQAEQDRVSRHHRRKYGREA